MDQIELSELLGFDVSRETFERLNVYHDLLIQWSKTHNLIGPKEQDHIWSRHILDCLQVWPEVGDVKKVLDIGSGAGLPGLVLACRAVEQNTPELVLVEPLAKRCAFLRHVSHRLKLPTQILNQRIEDVSRETVDVITSRAVAELTVLLEMGRPWLENGAKAVFLKGRNWKEELTHARRYWNFNVQVTPSKSDSFGVILSLSEVHSING